MQEIAVFSEDGNVFIWDVLAGVQKHCLDHTTEVSALFNGKYCNMIINMFAVFRFMIDLWTETMLGLTRSSPHLRRVL